jgi:hypothetical protein
MTGLKQIRFQPRRFCEPPKSQVCAIVIVECSTNPLIRASANWQSRDFDGGLLRNARTPRRATSISITYRSIPELAEWHDSCTSVLARSWENRIDG